MAIAHEARRSTMPKLVVDSSSRWIIGYAVFAAFAIAATIGLAFYGQGLTELDPSALIGP